MLDANAIHAALGANGWRNVLLAAGLTEKTLTKRHGPCPACGGTDRFRFDNKRGRGDFYCSHCGAGDGFKLLMNIQSVDFKTARLMVIKNANLDDSDDEPRPKNARAPVQPQEVERASPTQRVNRLMRETCSVEDCEAAVRYLQGRKLWPLPLGHFLRAHPSVEYWEDAKRVGRYPALIAPVRDIEGEVITVHVTYLESTGEKLRDRQSRKLLSGMTGREGCAVRLMRHDDTLGIAEGIETAFSAAVLHNVPVWAALNAGLLSKFEPPENVHRLVIFADRDIAGLDAAAKLMQRLQGKVALHIETPEKGDWNDALRGRAA